MGDRRRHGRDDGGQLRIERFSPNCLMGTVEALARVRYGVANLNRLFFDYTFVYTRAAAEMSRSQHPEILDVTFSRALPLSKQEFLQRLDHHYGLCLYHKPYTELDGLRSDLMAFIRAGEPVLIEIDFFHFPGHLFEGRRHDGHVMIVVKAGATTDTVNVVEAVFGCHDFPLSAIEACFEDTLARGRPYYLATARRRAPQSTPLAPDEVLADLDRTLANLTSTQDDRGLRALERFVADFRRFYCDVASTDGMGFLIPGFWAFMCNAMNNRRHLIELERDLPWVPSHTCQALQRRMGWLNKRWFVLDLAMNRSVQDNDFAATSGMLDTLTSIVRSEGETLDLIAALREGVARG